MKYDKVEALGDGEPDHDDATDGLLHNEKSTPLASRLRRLTMFPWLLIIEHLVIAAVFIILFFTLVPPRTNLKYESLTPDNKIYPSGPLSWSQHFEALPCGKTPEEALARGCKFDMLVTAWLPPRCMDHELIDEFMTLGDWQFYTRQDGTDIDKFGTYDPQFIGSVNQTVWTTRRWHATHCLFMFKKLTRALVNGWTTDAEAVSEPHMEHCMKVFIEQVLFGKQRDPMEVETYLEIIYPPC